MIHCISQQNYLPFILLPMVIFKEAVCFQVKIYLKLCPEGHILLSKEIWVYPLVGMRNGHPWWFRPTPPTPPLGASKLFNLLRRLVVKAEIYLTAPLTYSKLHQYLSWCSSLMSFQRVFFLRFIFLCPKGQKTEMMFFSGRFYAKYCIVYINN